jgi:hypothetical protein
MTAVDAFVMALERIEPDRIDHPQLGVQERVLCYELYHQLRLIEERGQPDWHPVRLQGELNKQGQHLLAGKQAVPDFLLHHPGTAEGNLAVVEVKRTSAGWSRIVSDVTKLARFAHELDYKERILVLFNGKGERLDRVRSRIAQSYSRGDTTIDVLFFDVGNRAVDSCQIACCAEPMDAASRVPG